MTYRDDHDAALARIAALEAENRRLAEENRELKETEVPGELPVTPAPTPKARGSWGMKVVIGIGIVVGGAGAVFGVVAGVRACATVFAGPKVSGTLVMTGPALGGDWVLAPGTCVSGQHMQFFGVDLVDKTDDTRILRLLVDPVQGRIAKMNIPGSDRARILDQPSCTVWDWTIDPTNTTYNDIRLVDGHVALDCAFAEGGTIKGRIDFSGCR